MHALPRRTMLIIDDETALCASVVDFFKPLGIEVLTARTGEEGISRCEQTVVDVILLDQKLPDMNGHELSHAILERNGRAKIIFITAFPTFESAVTAVRTGAHDYLSKPLDLNELRAAVERAFRVSELERIEQIHHYERERQRQTIGLVGTGIAHVTELIRSAAGSRSPVLITGETGTGKSLAARSIHFSGPLPDAAFFTVNCAAIPEGLIEAELFGHEKGAFTGAVAAKQGLFEVADGGTLFLDEIGEMPLHLQSKLLNVLEEGVIRRVGGTVMRRVNVRVLAATNVDLEQALGKTFRKDLFYRLSVIHLHLPPLRERKQDLAALCSVLLADMGSGRHFEFPADEVARLQAYDWPGNVRELRNILERTLLVQSGDEFRPSLLLAGRHGAQTEAFVRQPLPHDPRTLREIELDTIKETLGRFEGNVTATAKALGVSLSTLKRRLRDFDIHR